MLQRCVVYSLVFAEAVIAITMVIKYNIHFMDGRRAKKNSQQQK